MSFREESIAVALRVESTAPCAVGRSTHVHADMRKGGTPPRPIRTRVP